MNNEKIKEIQQVEGFNPADLSEKLFNAITGKEITFLPVRAQKAWFRLKFPKGKLSTAVIRDENGICMARARVYEDRADAENSFLSENFATRTWNSSDPSNNYRDRAVTMAIGRALEDAGFGLQADWTGEPFTDLVPGKTDDVAKIPPATAPVSVESSSEELVPQPLQPEELAPLLSLETEAELPIGLPKTKREALDTICTKGSMAGKPFSEVLMDPVNVRIIPWIIKNEESKNIDRRCVTAAKILQKVSAMPDAEDDEIITV